MGKNYSKAICERDHTGDVPQQVLDALPENQGHPVRHRCAACAYEAGLNEAKEDIKNLMAQLQQLTAENVQLRQERQLKQTQSVDDDAAVEHALEVLDDERWATIVGSYPDGEFKNLTRSTIALLAYWRDPDARLKYLAEHLDAPDLLDAVVSPEFPTPSISGKASFTDLLLESRTTAVGIEGKRSEGRYPTVSAWCDSANKRRVLEHWWSLIRPRTALQAEPDMRSLIYQMVHRTASVCARPAARAIVLYQLFGSDHVRDYESDLGALAATLGTSAKVEVWLHVVQLEETDEYKAVDKELRTRPAGEHSQLIRSALARGDLFRFIEDSPRRITSGQR